MKFINTVWGALIFVLMFLACSYPDVSPRYYEKAYPNRDSDVVQTFYGKSSYYGKKFHGRKTANGEVFDMYKMTAAHKTLPFGTICRVTNRSNGKQVTVRINDRGPFVAGRILDLSYAAALQIDGVRAGVMDVKVEVLEMGDGK